MKRTSILLEFSDEVYNNIVVPMKKNKSFAKLVASLVEGYFSDAYIRAYADDTLEDMRKASITTVNESIDAMNASLSSLGMFTSELENMSILGKKKMESVSEKASKEMMPTVPIISPSESMVDYAKNEEVSALNKRIDSMQGTLDKLVSLVSNLSVQAKDSETKTSVTVDSDTVKPEIEQEVKNSDLSSMSLVVSEDIGDIDEVDSGESSEGLDFMQSMLEGNSFSF